MRHPWISTVVLVALSTFGCSRSEKAEAPAAGAAEPAAAAPAAEPAAAAPAAEPEVSAAPPAPYNGFDYACADGVSFNAKIDKGNALLTIDGKTATLTPVAGAVGAQYAGEGLTFIARGDEAMLVRDGQAPQSCKAKS
jgi:membrane-bound inhibitor of C-type lysozyme